MLLVVSTLLGCCHFMEGASNPNPWYVLILYTLDVYEYQLSPSSYKDYYCQNFFWPETPTIAHRYNRL